MRSAHKRCEPVRGENPRSTRVFAVLPLQIEPRDSDYGSEEHSLSSPSSSSERSRSTVSCSRGVEYYLDRLIHADRLRLTRDSRDGAWTSGRNRGAACTPRAHESEKQRERVEDSEN